MINYVNIIDIAQKGADYATVQVKDIVHNSYETFIVKTDESIMNYVKKQGKNIYGKTNLKVIVSTDYGRFGNNLQIATPNEIEKFNLKYGEYLI